MTASCRVMGLDPGLRHTGWGVIEVAGTHLRHIAHGAVHSDSGDDLSERLRQLHDQLADVLDTWQPDEAAVEETFVNKNPLSTLKLGQARGVVLLAPALRGISVAEYAPNMVKKAVVGSGHAHKDQIHAMVGMLLPGVKIMSGDAADALSVAICHAYHRQSSHRLSNLTAAAEQRT